MSCHIHFSYAKLSVVTARKRLGINGILYSDYIICFF